MMMNLLLYTHISLSLSLFLIPIDLVSFANNFEFVESELPSHRTFPDPDFLGRLTWLARQPQRTSIPDSPGLEILSSA
jgi:hypothetical protein